MSAAVMASPAPRFGGNSNNATSNSAASISPNVHRSAARSNSGSPSAPAKASPPSANTSSRTAGPPPKIIVKKEPGSPDIPTARHRPRKLDLSKNHTGNSPATGRPLTSRADSSGLGIQDLGLACLSPGFVTQDPVMKEQLQRSISVREQQRHIIEARLQQQSAKGDGNMNMSMNMTVDSRGGDKEQDFSAKTPGMQSRRNKAPPGLSIVAPSHEHFANERVIQSAPLGQTFTGMHNHPHPLSRHIENRPSKLSNTSHIHHVPATQTNNRLPPISDVFGQGLSGHPHSEQHSMYAAQTGPHRAPLSSPSHPPAQQMPTPGGGRPREYKSAEEAQQELSGGRPELLPKLVHYGGHQPPTPPSPLPGAQRIDAGRSISTSMKRRREEYEHGISPPLGNGRPMPRLGPFGEGRDSPETSRAKKEEFIRLCERAWDLFHS